MLRELHACARRRARARRPSFDEGVVVLGRPVRRGVAVGREPRLARRARCRPRAGRSAATPCSAIGGAAGASGCSPSPARRAGPPTTAAIASAITSTARQASGRGAAPARAFVAAAADVVVGTPSSGAVRRRRRSARPASSSRDERRPSSRNGRPGPSPCARSTSASTRSGTSGRRRSTFGTGSLTCRIATATKLSPGYGTSPVSSS